MTIDFELPTWQECADLIEAGDDLTTVQEFVYHQEPGGSPNDSEWREMLTAAIVQAIADAKGFPS